MINTVELIERLKAAYHLPSDYAAAKKLGITTSAVSKYRCGISVFGDKTAVEVAELLDLDPLHVIASMHIERAQKTHDENAINFWRQYAA